MARGMSNREVADQLYISENTVKNHMRNILEKLHLHSRMEAVMYAVRKRLLSPTPPEGSRAQPPALLIRRLQHWRAPAPADPGRLPAAVRR